MSSRAVTPCRGDPFRGFGKIYLQTAKAVCLAHLQAIPKGIAVCVAGREHELPIFGSSCERHRTVNSGVSALSSRAVTPCRGDPFRGFGKIYLQTAKAVCLAHLQAIPKGIAVCVAGREHELPIFGSSCERHRTVNSGVSALSSRAVTPCRGAPSGFRQNIPTNRQGGLSCCVNESPAIVAGFRGG